MKKREFHGMRMTKIYKVWDHMRGRCLNKRDKKYPRYGGRGITICERWANFSVFYKDMGDCPPGKSIDRINNDLGYEPSNCRWATRKEQMRNTSTSRQLTAFGETKTVADWADDWRCTVKYDTLHTRIKNGWSPQMAIIAPRRNRSKWPVSTADSQGDGDQ